MKKIRVMFVVYFVVFNMFMAVSVKADDFYEDEPCIELSITSENNSNSSQLPRVNAGAAIILDMNSGRVLFEKNAYSRMPMASTTKIMTAIIAIENGKLDDTVTISKRAAGIGGSTIGLKAEQTYKLHELLYGLMLNSGNDAAIAIGEYIGGTLENFIDMMNLKAEELGMKDTCFQSPHGLDREYHYTTAYDLATLTRYALANPIFSEIVKTKAASIPNKDLYNTNEMLNLYPGADGVKTGYTGQAGRCLVTSVTRDNWRIISVVLNCSSRQQRAQNSKNILDYAFNNYKVYTLLEPGEKVKELPIIKGIEGKVSIQSIEEINIPLRKEEIDSMKTRLELPDNLQAPVRAGVKVGEIKFVVNGKVIAQSVVKTANDIGRKDFPYYIYQIIKSWGEIVRK